MDDDYLEAVLDVVAAIPAGRVMTYGQIATLLESRLSPRAVGWAMHGCPEGVPAIGIPFFLADGPQLGSGDGSGAAWEAVGPVTVGDSSMRPW